MEKNNPRLDRFFAGETSLEEEQKIYREALDEQTAIKGLAFVAKKHKIVAPEELEKTAWEAIDQHRKKHKKAVWRHWAIAASIALLVSLGIGYLTQHGQSEAEKKRLLQEALYITNTEQQTIHKEDILYEDELIIVYLSE